MMGRIPPDCREVKHL